MLALAARACPAFAHSQRQPRDQRNRMKLLAALLFGAASALQPAQVKPAAVDRRAAMKFTFPAAVAAALAPAAALAAKPPQLQSMQPPRRAKTGQIKTGNAGSIMKK
ncbi:unnamed protein product [Pelagomonas calceolata]|uniref:Uncharacterized protein n=1 Tax=Pelagomonas calceolata TaxID=35677 RepID=A0A8J2SWG5_9STRA|nr:unnamed protein product [Pelagomonas calceolata]